VNYIFKYGPFPRYWLSSYLIVTQAIKHFYQNLVLVMEAGGYSR